MRDSGAEVSEEGQKLSQKGSNLYISVFRETFHSVSSRGFCRVRSLITFALFFVKICGVKGSGKD